MLQSYIQLEEDGTYTVVRLRGNTPKPLATTANIERAEALRERIEEGASLLEALAAMSGFSLL